MLIFEVGLVSPKIWIPLRVEKTENLHVAIKRPVSPWKLDKINYKVDN